MTCRKKLRQTEVPPREGAYQREILEIAFLQGTQMDPKDRKPGTEDKVTADVSTYCLTRLPHIKYIKVKPLKLWGCRVWEKEVALLQNHIFFFFSLHCNYYGTKRKDLLIDVSACKQQCCTFFLTNSK